jgi:hypothetical protein
MKKFTLRQIGELFNQRHNITHDRFIYYFTVAYGMDKYDAKECWEIYEKFPYYANRDTEIYAKFEDIIEKIRPILEAIGKAAPIHATPEARKIKKKVFYRLREGGEELSVVFDLNSASDVIAYAELLKSGCEIIRALDAVDTISSNRIVGSERGQFLVFDGDIFVVTDVSYSRSNTDNIYVCKRGTYYRLLYTLGKGYLRNGRPDYDEENEYNSHVLTVSSESVKRIGNIYVDCSMLDDNQEHNSLTDKK